MELASDLLIIHLEENDLTHTSVAELTSWILKDLQRVAEILPGTRLAWGDPLPWRVWKRTIKPKTVDNSRKINQTLHWVMEQNGGTVVAQPGICFGFPHLFGVIVYISLLRDVIFISPIWPEESQLLLFEDLGGQGESS